MGARDFIVEQVNKRPLFGVILVILVAVGIAFLAIIVASPLF